MSRADQIADSIINSVVAKKRRALIDQDVQWDNITTEESQKRIILLGQMITIINSFIASYLIILNCKIIHTKYFMVSPEINEGHSFPIPYITFMDKNGLGKLMTFKLNQNLTFELDWEFNVPSQPKGTGYFTFEDQGNIFVTNAKMTTKMTVIHSPLKHNTISNRSGLPLAN